MKKVCFATVVLSLAVCGQAQAGVDTLFAVDTGWYDMGGSHTPSNDNYLVGDVGGNNYHNFAVFDLSVLTNDVLSATFRLFLGEAPPNTEDGYLSVDPTETYAVYDVTTDIGVLTGGAGGVGAYNDLAGGTFYGEVVVSAADNGEFVEVVLNSDAIAALNANGGLFAFGGNITSIDHPMDQNEALFWFSHQSPDVQLSVTYVPAPGAIALLAPLGLGAIGRRRRR